MVKFSKFLTFQLKQQVTKIPAEKDSQSSLQKKFEVSIFLEAFFSKIFLRIPEVNGLFEKSAV